jgi:hypothetical protein
MAWLFQINFIYVYILQLDDFIDLLFVYLTTVLVTQ